MIKSILANQTRVNHGDTCLNCTPKKLSKPNTFLSPFVSAQSVFLYTLYTEHLSIRNTFSSLRGVQFRQALLDIYFLKS